MATSTRCTEDQLLGIAGAYMDSLTANDPAGAPLALDLRATENGVDISTDEGLWKSARGWLYRHTFVDEDSGEIGAFGSIIETGDQDAIIGLRLKVVDGAINESETLIARKGDFALFEPRAAREPRAIFSSFLPKSRQTSADELADIPRRYFEAIAKGDPSIAPAHPDCQRLENGVQTTMSPLLRSPSQSESFRRLVYMQHTRGLRVPVVDVERGLVFCVVAIDMPLMSKTITVRGRPHEIKPERHSLPRTLCLYELFKVESGRIRSIEAVMRNASLGFDMGWS